MSMLLLQRISSKKKKKQKAQGSEQIIAEEVNVLLEKQGQMQIK